MLNVKCATEDCCNLVTVRRAGDIGYCFDCGMRLFVNPGWKTKN